VHRALANNRPLNPQYHAEQRNCHTTFRIAYEAPVAPLRTTNTIESTFATVRL
jgi:hypothetical protein